MDNGSKFLSYSFEISMAFEQLLKFLFSSNAPHDLISDMMKFKSKYDDYRNSFFDAYLKGVCKSGSDSESELSQQSRIDS